MELTVESFCRENYRGHFNLGGSNATPLIARRIQIALSQTKQPTVWPNVLLLGMDLSPSTHVRFISDLDDVVKWRRVAPLKNAKAITFILDHPLASMSVVV